MANKSKEPGSSQQAVENVGIISDDLIKMTKKELLHALKQSRGFLNYSSRRLNTEKTMLAELMARCNRENNTNPEFERNVLAVQSAAVMFEHINKAYEEMIRFANICFDETSGIESNKSMKKKSKVTNPKGVEDHRDNLPIIQELVLNGK